MDGIILGKLDNLSKPQRPQLAKTLLRKKKKYVALTLAPQLHVVIVIKIAWC